VVVGGDGRCVLILVLVGRWYCRGGLRPGSGSIEVRLRSYVLDHDNFLHGVVEVRSVLDRDNFEAYLNVLDRGGFGTYLWHSGVESSLNNGILDWSYLRWRLRC
jgi:hypothetical protein